jgi:zinc/manganese transport system substrate-binding protein
MRKIIAIPFTLCLVLLLGFVGCRNKPTPDLSGKKTVVVTYSIMASLVKELAGDQFNVTAAVPNGLDPHEWEPSARDMEQIMSAALIVENGLGLEGGMGKALARARSAGVKFFTISEHVKIRTVGRNEGLPGDDPDQAVGASDPHFWMDPLTVKTALFALADSLKASFTVDVSKSMGSLAERLDKLDASIRTQVSTVPAEKRRLVTGHESLGYFAARYGFTLVGTVVPSLTSGAEVSAADMAALKRQIIRYDVPVIFTELGTPSKVVEALADEAHVKAVPLVTHSLPPDMSYFTMMDNLSREISGNCK